MTSQTVQKFNIEAIPKTSDYMLTPLSFLGKHKKGKFNAFTKPNGSALARADIKILSLIYTLNNNFGNKDKLFKAQIARKCGLTGNTVRKSLERLALGNLIESDENGVYKIKYKVNASNYIIIDNYLHTAKFNVVGKVKKLSQTAVAVLERVISFYREYRIDPRTKERIYINYDFVNKKVINYFCGAKSLATYMNLPRTTVSDAIRELISAGLLFRNKRLRYKDLNGFYRYKTVNTLKIPGNTQSLFSVPYELLAVERKSSYIPQEVNFDESASSAPLTVTNAEIEDEYRTMRERAESVARANREKALGDVEFRKLREELESTSSTSDIENLIPRYNICLARLGLTEQELNPIYNCDECADTGQLDTGQYCPCRKKVRQTILNRKYKA